jgi:hypothetical protein
MKYKQTSVVVVEAETSELLQKEIDNTLNHAHENGFEMSDIQVLNHFDSLVGVITFFFWDQK